MARPDFDDLGGLPRRARWVLMPFQLTFGTILVIGFFSFIAFFICFFLTFRGGAPSPTAEQVAPLRDHAQVVYVTPAKHRLVEFLKVVSLGGIAIGLVGTFAVQAIARGLRKACGCPGPLPPGPGIIVAPDRRAPRPPDTMKP